MNKPSLFTDWLIKWQELAKGSSEHTTSSMPTNLSKPKRGKAVYVHAMKAYRGSGGNAPVKLNIGTRSR
jgi:hypothetical protein